MKKIVLNIIKSTSPNYRKFFALIDDKDFHKVNKYNWTVDFNGNTKYACNLTTKKHIFMHNLVMGSKGIDHINGNGLDNRRCNLRKATHRQNMMNKARCKDNSSIYKGVCFKKDTGKWAMQINTGGQFYSKRFNSEKLAARAYDKKAIELFGKFARLNFPKNKK